MLFRSLDISVVWDVTSHPGVSVPPCERNLLPLSAAEVSVQLHQII